MRRTCFETSRLGSVFVCFIWVPRSLLSTRVTAVSCIVAVLSPRNTTRFVVSWMRRIGWSPSHPAHGGVRGS